VSGFRRRGNSITALVGAETAAADEGGTAWEIETVGVDSTEACFASVGDGVASDAVAVAVAGAGKAAAWAEGDCGGDGVAGRGGSRVGSKGGATSGKAGGAGGSAPGGGGGGGGEEAPGWVEGAVSEASGIDTATAQRIGSKEDAVVVVVVVVAVTVAVEVIAWVAAVELAAAVFGIGVGMAEQGGTADEALAAVVVGVTEGEASVEGAAGTGAGAAGTAAARSSWARRRRVRSSSWAGREECGQMGRGSRPKGEVGDGNGMKDRTSTTHFQLAWFALGFVEELPSPSPSLPLPPLQTASHPPLCVLPRMWHRQRQRRDLKEARVALLAADRRRARRNDTAAPGEADKRKTDWRARMR